MLGMMGDKRGGMMMVPAVLGHLWLGWVGIEKHFL